MKTRKLDMTVMLLYILSGIISYTKIFNIEISIAIYWFIYSNSILFFIQIKE